MLKSKWNKGLTTLLFLILLTTPVFAQNNLLSHVTLRQYPQGSFSVRYGGVRGLITNQLTSQLHTLYREWASFQYADNPSAAREELFQITQAQRDIDNGGAWFNRRWWESLPIEKGGAPAHHISVFRGRTRHLIDAGFAYITSDFRFNWREYEVNLTHALTPSSQFKIHNYHEWKLRFKPRASFSIKTIIQDIAAAAIFEYSHKSVRLIEIQVYCSYSIRLSGVQVGFSLSLLQW